MPALYSRLEDLLSKHPEAGQVNNTLIDPVIIANDIRKKYEDIDAVNGISFQVRRGEIFGMLGPNGAGKTTTVEILEGMRNADSGEAVIDGINVKKDPTAVKSIIGVQLQQNAFFDNLKLSEIVPISIVLC